MSGQARGMLPSLARATLRAAEPGFAGVTAMRNALYDRQLLRIRSLPKPVISIGNLTTGGTGKTPAVQWFVRELIALGKRPAVLTRGYRRTDGKPSDEEAMLRRTLSCPIIADPDRYRGGMDALKQDAAIDVFVLDDGFQHRRLARDLDVVLIDATSPFGYGHLLPRGMLREPLRNLRRATLVMITRSDLVEADTLASIEADIRRHHPSAIIVHTQHLLADAVIRSATTRLASLVNVMAFCGIGNPAAFRSTLDRAGANVIGLHAFPDHHAYAANDVSSLIRKATETGAGALLTTEKDWVKLDTPDLHGLIAESTVPFGFVPLRLGITEPHRQQVLAVLTTTLNQTRHRRET